MAQVGPPHVFFVCRWLREGAGLHDPAHQPCERVSGRGIAEQAQRLGGAALDQWRRVGERRDERIARARVSEQTERERGHLPHLGIAVGQHSDERLHAVCEADVTDRERGAPAHARLFVREQPKEIGGRRRW